jgi:hypothetical protein
LDSFHEKDKVSVPLDFILPSWRDWRRLAKKKKVRGRDTQIADSETKQEERNVFS